VPSGSIMWVPSLASFFCFIAAKNKIKTKKVNGIWNNPLYRNILGAGNKLTLTIYWLLLHIGFFLCFFFSFFTC
jgi:hypothetical protein